MADTKITALTALTAADPSTDVLPIVDTSDTTMAASGTTKKISINNILGASGTATLASATISGDLTVDTSTLKVDSANNRVGIGTATPARPLDIVGSFQSSLGWVLTGTPAGLGAATRYIGGASTTDSWYFNALTGGNHLWAFGESLAMTLNSTGLGVGVTPSYKLDVSTGGVLNTTARLVGNDQSNVRLRFENTGASGRIWELVGGFAGSNNRWFSLHDVTGSTTPWGVDDSMNVISNVTGTAPTLSTNSQMVFNLTSNTNLRISVRGTDGTTRTANITLA